MGKCNPAARCNISPVITKFFAATQSMQNFWVPTNTNGYYMYIWKYVTKLDMTDRCTIPANNHNSAAMRMYNTFLHNTKIRWLATNKARAFR